MPPHLHAGLQFSRSGADGVLMRHVFVAALSSIAAVLLWAAWTPHHRDPAPVPAAEARVWHTPHRTVRPRALPRALPEVRVSIPPGPASLSEPTLPPPNGRATIHIEDRHGAPVDDLWLSWVCHSDDSEGPEVRIPVAAAQEIDGFGDCLFQAVDHEGRPVSDDLPVALASGEHHDVWLVVDPL